MRNRFAMLLFNEKRPFEKDLVSGKRDSNSRPQPWQGCALPTELFPQERMVSHCECKGSKKVVHSKFFGPYFMVFYSVKDRNSDIWPISGVRRSMSRALEPGNTPPLFIPISLFENERSVAYGFVPSPVVRRKVTYCYPVRRSVVTTNRTIDRTNRVILGP